MHESLDEYKFRPDTVTTTNTRVICPCTSEKFMYNVNTSASIFDRIFFIFAGKDNLTIKSWTSLKFDQIGPWTAELAALERLKKSP